MSFVRLNVIAEGQTEEGFVRRVLCPHLADHSTVAVARSVLTSKDRRPYREYRGGLSGYSKARSDIVAWLKEDRQPEARFTTMFDLYALPSDFPSFEEAKRRADPYFRVAELEKAFAADIDDPRFVPYIQLHEFESLILADAQKLGTEYLEHNAPVQALMEMVEREGGNPELIDDGPDTAPSKRILAKIPEYDKVNSGPVIAALIGIPVLRRECRHFNEWLTKLEGLISD